MAISVKSKFAGFLRGLIGRADNRAPARSVAPAAPASVPALATPAAKISTPPVSSAARATNLDEIELPLSPILTGLPLELKAKLMSGTPADKTIRLPAEMVISQLAFGAVKISFGELRQLAPGVFVNSGGELDNKPVSLPLNEILPRLNPTLLARRAAKKVEVATEITGPFADRGKGFTFTTQPLKAPLAPPAPESAPAPAHAAEAPIAFVPPAGMRQVSPTPPAPSIPQRSITPAAPTISTNGNGNGHSIPISPLSPPRSVTPAAPTLPATNGGNGSHSNGNGNGKNHALPPGLKLGPTNGNGNHGHNGNGHADLLPPAKMSAAPAPTSAPATPCPVPAQPTIFAPLGDLCETWPEELKNEILSSPLAKASVPLDGAIVFPGLKRGRVTMTWKQLRVLAQPSSAVSPHDSLELELPLKVIAPLFLAAQKNLAKPQIKTSVSNDIPDLFFGFPQTAAPPIAPVPLAASAAPKPQPKPETKPQDTNFYVWGEKSEAPQTDEAGLRRSDIPQTDFMSRQAHPKEVVQRAGALPGVVGAVVAMQDGLRVAAQVPSEFNPDTLAAFLPQIFDRLNQSTRELRMGSLNNINFTVGNVPWKIFRVNAVYFAAFGRAGEQLPTAQLAQLAAELDRKKQQ